MVRLDTPQAARRRRRGEEHEGQIEGDEGHGPRRRSAFHERKRVHPELCVALVIDGPLTRLPGVDERQGGEQACGRRRRRDAAMDGQGAARCGALASRRTPCRSSHLPRRHTAASARPPAAPSWGPVAAPARAGPCRGDGCLRTGQPSTGGDERRRGRPRGRRTQTPRRRWRSTLDSPLGWLHVCCRRCAARGSL